MTTTTLPAVLPVSIHDLIGKARDHAAHAERAAQLGRTGRTVRAHQVSTREALIGAAGVLLGLGIVGSLRDGILMIEEATGIVAPHRNI